MRCFACGDGSLLAAGQRIGFRETCEACDADLHVCRNCAHHDADAYNECRESQAERVDDRERANRCEWFSPGEQTGGKRAAEQGIARRDLAALFKKP